MDDAEERRRNEREEEIKWMVASGKDFLSLFSFSPCTSSSPSSSSGSSFSRSLMMMMQPHHRFLMLLVHALEEECLFSCKEFDAIEISCRGSAPGRCLPSLFSLLLLLAAPAHTTHQWHNASGTSVSPTAVTERGDQQRVRCRQT